MPKNNKKELITIDGKEYSMNDLTDEAKAQLLNIQFVDERIQQLNNELAVTDTARIGYTNALSRECEKIKGES